MALGVSSVGNSPTSSPSSESSWRVWINGAWIESKLLIVTVFEPILNDSELLKVGFFSSASAASNASTSGNIEWELDRFFVEAFLA